MGSDIVPKTKTSEFVAPQAKNPLISRSLFSLFLTPHICKKIYKYIGCMLTCHINHAKLKVSKLAQSLSEEHTEKANMGRIEL